MTSRRLAALNRKNRILRLFHDGLPAAQIAAATGVGVSYVNRVLQEARKAAGNPGKDESPAAFQRFLKTIHAGPDILRAARGKTRREFWTACTSGNFLRYWIWQEKEEIQRLLELSSAAADRREPESKTDDGWRRWDLVFADEIRRLVVRPSSQAETLAEVHQILRSWEDGHIQTATLPARLREAIGDQSPDPREGARGRSPSPMRPGGSQGPLRRFRPSTTQKQEISRAR